MELQLITQGELQMKIKKGTIASVIILIISGFAFAAGFLQGNILSGVQEVKLEISEKKTTLDRINTRIREIIEDDRTYLRKASDELLNAEKLALELEITNSSLTPLERDLLMNLIGNALGYFVYYVNITHLLRMYKYWYLWDDPSDYYIATEEIDGFDLYFSKAEFDSFNASEVFLDFPVEDYVISYGVAPTLYYKWWWLNYIEFMEEPVFELQQEISEQEIMRSELESKASFYGYGVALITVTTILAAAMGTQMNDKEREKELADIKAKIFDDKSMIISKRDKIALPILIIAFVLAALGMLLPLLLGFVL